MSLPAADDLFRPSPAQPRGEREPAAPREREASSPSPSQSPSKSPSRSAAAKDEAPTREVRRSSGRVRHDEKVTVYVTADELLDLEHARLTMRRDQGLAVDRGRLVREAVAIALADLETRGEDSEIVRRLLAR